MLSSTAGGLQQHTVTAVSRRSLQQCLCTLASHSSASPCSALGACRVMLSARCCCCVIWSRQLGSCMQQGQSRSEPRCRQHAGRCAQAVLDAPHSVVSSISLGVLTSFLRPFQLGARPLSSNLTAKCVRPQLRGHALGLTFASPSTALERLVFCTHSLC